MGDIVSGRVKLMVILQFRSITIQAADMQNYPGMFSDIQQYLPAQKTHRRRSRKKRETVGHLIDEIIDSLK